MDYLREGIHLRGFAQIDPLVAYKNEAFTLFGDLMNSVWADYARMIFNVQVNVEGENGQPAPGALVRGRRAAPRGPGGSPTRAAQSAAAPGRWRPPRRPRRQAGTAAVRRRKRSRRSRPSVEQRVVDEEHQVGRNDPCWCGSGKKYKKCHGA